MKINQHDFLGHLEVSVKIKGSDDGDEGDEGDDNDPTNTIFKDHNAPCSLFSLGRLLYPGVTGNNGLGRGGGWGGGQKILIPE